MLIKFTFENFKSYLDESSILMSSNSKIRKHKDHESHVNLLSVLKYIGIYGENATGKTTIIEALQFFKMFSCFNAYPDDFNICHKEATDKPTSLSLVFSVDNEIFEYGFSVEKSSNILSKFHLSNEYISIVGSGPRRGREIYSTTRGVNPAFIEEENKSLLEFLVNGYRLSHKTNGSMTFLNYMTKNDHVIQNSKLSLYLTKIMNYIKNNIVIIGANVTNLNYVNKEFVTITNRCLSKFDKGLEKLELVTLDEDLIRNMFPENIRNEMLRLFEKQNNNKQGVVITQNNKDFIFMNKEGNKFVYQTLSIKHRFIEKPFKFYEESEGTRKFITLMSYFASKDNDKTFVIDELERSMHPCACDYLFEFFEKETSKSNTQFIFTSHNERFINERLRFDEIYYTNKDMYGGSIVYPQTDFKTSSATNVGKNYLEGKYKKVS